MQQMNIILNGDGAFKDVDPEKVIHIGEGSKPITVAVLAGGMASGLPSVTIRIDLPNGQVVLAETTARLFCSSARAIMGRYPDLFEGGKPGSMQ